MGVARWYLALALALAAGIGGAFALREPDAPALSLHGVQPQPPRDSTEELFRYSVPRLSADLRIGDAADSIASAYDTPVDREWRALVEVVGPVSRLDFDRVDTTIRAFNDALVERDLPYLLLPVWKSMLDPPQLYGFSIERFVPVRVHGTRYVTRDVRRIEGNTMESTYGMVIDGFIHRPLAIVFRDFIDEAGAAMLPILADGGTPRAIAWKWASPDGAAYRDAVHRALRRELSRALGPDVLRAIRVAVLLAERRHLVEPWPNPTGISIDTVSLPRSFVDGPLLSDRDRVLAIEDELDRLDAAALATRLGDLIAHLSRRHEIQHVVDFERPAPLVPPAELLDLRPPAGVFDPATRELSGWLGGIATEHVIPQFSVWLLADHCLVDPRALDYPQLYTAVIILDGLARHLGITLPGPLLHDDAVDRMRVTQIAMQIATRDGADIRRAAAALWAELFGEPFEPIVLE